MIQAKKYVKNIKKPVFCAENWVELDKIWFSILSITYILAKSYKAAAV